MQLDTETAAAILKSSAQCNAVAEEATRRVVELMQEGIEYRARIAELEAVVRKYHDWHLKIGGDGDGYLDSGMYEDACAAVPGLAAIGKN